MQHIQLSNDSFILHTQKGATHVTRSNFNFTKIKNMIKKGTDEESLLPLLEPPELPDGIYEAYESIPSAKMYYKHMYSKLDQFSCYYKQLGKNDSTKLDNQPDNCVFVGVYASLKDLHYDWPEYLV